MKLAAFLIAVLPQTTALGPSGELGPPLPPPAAAPMMAVLSAEAPALDPFTPVGVLAIPNGPRVVKLPAEGSPVLALRVSLNIDEGPAEAGAGRLLQILATQRAQGRAAGLGLHFEGTRTPWGIAYTVVGARAEIADMVSLLREALAAPDDPDSEFQRRRLGLRDEVLRTVETPAGRILNELRGRAAPGASPIDGTPGSLDRMTRTTLRDLWARSHRADGMTVLVSGDVPDEELTAALRDLAPEGGRAGARPGGSLPPASTRGTQVFRHWYGEAYRVSEPRDPHGAVAALLASDWLRSSAQGFEAEVQLLEVGNVQLLTALAAAYSGQAATMRQRVPRLLAGTQQTLDAEQVRVAVAHVRQQVLQQARTPAGLVSVVGWHLDATGEPDSARRFLTALDRVTMDSTRRFFAQLEQQTPLRAEVRP